MARRSHREILLTEGLRVVHERGLSGASVRDIVQAAGVPQGSFTNHFASKEAFTLEVVHLYRQRARASVDETLRSDAKPPLGRLREWIEKQLDQLREDDMRKGCLCGNLAAEASEQSEAMRTRIAEIYAQDQDSVAYCLRGAVDAGELSATSDTTELAGFIVSSLQGAILVAKTQRSPAPIECFIAILFGAVLRSGGRKSRPSSERAGPHSAAAAGPSRQGRVHCCTPPQIARATFSAKRCSES